MFPSKAVKINESVLYYFPSIIKDVQKENYLLENLWKKYESKLDIDKFLFILSCLYVLDKIDFIEGVIVYVTRD